MKTIWDLFVISIVAVIIFTGIFTIGDFRFQQGTLDDQSNEIFAEYATVYLQLQNDFNETSNQINVNGVNELEVEGDVNGLDAFIKEYGEAKDRINTLRSTTSMITFIPDLIVLSIPFIDSSDLEYYRNIAILMLFVVIGISIFMALFNRRVNKTS